MALLAFFPVRGLCMWKTSLLRCLIRLDTCAVSSVYIASCLIIIISVAILAHSVVTKDSIQEVAEEDCHIRHD